MGKSVDTRTILVVNPGSTSTKVSLFRLLEGNLTEMDRVSVDVPSVTEPGRALETRLPGIREFASRYRSVDCVVGRGGLLRPLSAGIYRVSETMIEELLGAVNGWHASNLGAPIADAIAQEHQCPAIVVDPVVVDEFTEVARISGLAGIERRSRSHALNLRAVSRRASNHLGKRFEECRFIGVHLGGGISVAAILDGRIVDVNDSNEGGPFSPQRTGSLPILQLIDLCFSGDFGSAEEVKQRVTTAGGLVSYLGTDSVEETIQRVEDGDVDAEKFLRAMAYQIAKEIGATAAVLCGKVDAIIFTGGFARSPVIDWISERVDWIAQILEYPGEMEMLALAEAAARMLDGIEESRLYL